MPLEFRAYYSNGYEPLLIVQLPVTLSGMISELNVPVLVQSLISLLSLQVGDSGRNDLFLFCKLSMKEGTYGSFGTTERPTQQYSVEMALRDELTKILTSCQSRWMNDRGITP